MRLPYIIRVTGLKLTELNYSPAIEAEEAFKWSEVRRGIFNVQIWLTSTAYFAMLSGVYSFGLFVRLSANPVCGWFNGY